MGHPAARPTEETEERLSSQEPQLMTAGEQLQVRNWLLPLGDGCSRATPPDPKDRPGHPLHSKGRFLSASRSAQKLTQRKNLKP